MSHLVMLFSTIGILLVVILEWVSPSQGSEGGVVMLFVVPLILVAGLGIATLFIQQHEDKSKRTKRV